MATANPILLADEPTGELDIRTGVRIVELLHEQTHELRTAVLVVTHNREIELSSEVVADGAPPGGRADMVAQRPAQTTATAAPRSPAELRAALRGRRAGRDAPSATS